MKQVKLRSMLLAALVAVLAAGILLFCVRYVVRGGQWAAFPANDHAYQEGRLALGQVLDRNGLVLYDGASGTWAEDGAIRRATLHAVGTGTTTSPPLPRRPCGSGWWALTP